MKHPLESLMTAAGILLMALLSSLLLPAPSLGLALAQKLVGIFHLMDLNQLYTLLFCLWVSVARRAGILCYSLYLAALVFAGRLNISMRTAMLFFTISAWRQVERAGKNARKGLLRIKTILETNIIHLLVGVAQVARRQF
ncbi:Putative inner membrane protein [Salmonella enterica subsp. enterica]|nr:Putative inner membrane protein [Salmonella enterica subsp. enterica]